MSEKYRPIYADGSYGALPSSPNQVYWYAYDGRDRVVVTKGTLAGAATRAEYARDALGRVTDYKEYNASASLLGHRWGIVYDVRGQVLTEFGQQKQGTDWTYNHTVNFYDAAGTGTVPGAALTSTANAGSSSGSMLYGSQTKYWTTRSEAVPIAGQARKRFAQ